MNEIKTEPAQDPRRRMKKKKKKKKKKRGRGMLALLLVSALAYLIPTAQAGEACPSYTQPYEKYCFAVMDKTPKAVIGCVNQDEFIDMPTNWSLVDFDKGLAAVLWAGPPSSSAVPIYDWGCDYLVYRNGRVSATWVADYRGAGT